MITLIIYKLCFINVNVKQERSWKLCEINSMSQYLDVIKLYYSYNLTNVIISATDTFQLFLYLLGCDLTKWGRNYLPQFKFCILSICCTFCCCLHALFYMTKQKRWIGKHPVLYHRLVPCNSRVFLIEVDNRGSSGYVCLITTIPTCTD